MPYTNLLPEGKWKTLINTVKYFTYIKHHCSAGILTVLLRMKTKECHTSAQRCQSENFARCQLIASNKFR